MPYAGSGVPFSEGHTVLGDCAGGNPNKHFHLPPGGVGQIKWATHPNKCLGVKDGQSFNGNQITLQNCYEGDPSWRQFDMSAGGADFSSPSRIKWSKNPAKCLDVAGGKMQSGTKVQLYDCHESWGAQLFTVAQPAPPAGGGPSLFCTSLSLPTGYEVDLLSQQLAKGVGIFACDAWAVVSNQSVVLRSGPGQPLSTVVMGGSLSVEFGGRWHTALNTEVFIRYWDKILADARSGSHDWTVKVDPDAVFFPERLREVLRQQYPPAGAAAAPVYLNNCYLGMHGPIEALSRQALASYKAGKDRCRSGAPFAHKQEDFYFRECWNLLGIAKVDVFNILLESDYACNERSSTRDGRHPCFSHQVSFHPFKSAAAYFECHRRATSQQWVAPMRVYSTPPGHGNLHHA